MNLRNAISKVLGLVFLFSLTACGSGLCPFGGCSSFFIFAEVLGQLTTTATGAGDGADRVANPRGIFSDGTRLYLADAGNNRVLIWNAAPTQNGQAADVVLGQPNFTDDTANNPSVRLGMQFPSAVFSDGTRLFVADTNNNRVLVWNSIPSENGKEADYVLGQTSLDNNGSSTSATTMDAPGGIYSDGTRLFVSDISNNRVLVWATIPTTNGKAADFALGQSGLGAGGAGSGANEMSAPHGIYAHGTKLYVADTTNSRVLGWDPYPTTAAGMGQAADFALGQTTTSASGANNPSRTASSMNRPWLLHGDGEKLFVADAFNHRVLVWDSLPTTTGQAADGVVGQPDFTSGTLNNGGVSHTSIREARGVFGTGSQLIIADTDNARITILPRP